MKSIDQFEKGKKVGLRIEFLSKERQIRVGEMSRFRFKITDSTMDKLQNNLDVRTMASLIPGIWQKRDWARFVADGVYEIALSVPHAGTYYVFFESPSMNVGYNQLPHLVLHAAGGGLDKERGALGDNSSQGTREE